MHRYTHVNARTVIDIQSHRGYDSMHRYIHNKLLGLECSDSQRPLGGKVRTFHSPCIDKQDVTRISLNLLSHLITNQLLAVFHFTGVRTAARFVHDSGLPTQWLLTHKHSMTYSKG